MSVATEIARIQTGRNAIRAKLVELGMAQNTDNLDKLAAAVEAIENRGAVSATVQEGDTYTIPKGYHNGSGTVSAVAGGGNYNLQSKTVTPTKLQQNVTPDPGYYGMSDVTVAPIPGSYQDVSAVTAAAGDVLGLTCRTPRYIRATVRRQRYYYMSTSETPDSVKSEVTKTPSVSLTYIVCLLRKA